MKTGRTSYLYHLEGCSSHSKTFCFPNVLTIIDLIKEDHQKIFSSYDSWKNASDPVVKQKWLNKFIWLVCRHSVGEELTFYPLMATIGDEGQQKADKARQEQLGYKSFMEKKT